MAGALSGLSANACEDGGEVISGGPGGIANTASSLSHHTPAPRKGHSICSHADLSVSVGSRHMRSIVLTSFNNEADSLRWPYAGVAYMSMPMCPCRSLCMPQGYEIETQGQSVTNSQLSHSQSNGFLSLLQHLFCVHSLGPPLPFGLALTQWNQFLLK